MYNFLLKEDYLIKKNVIFCFCGLSVDDEMIYNFLGNRVNKINYNVYLVGVRFKLSFLWLLKF